MGFHQSPRPSKLSYTSSQVLNANSIQQWIISIQQNALVRQIKRNNTINDPTTITHPIQPRIKQFQRLTWSTQDHLKYWWRVQSPNRSKTEGKRKNTQLWCIPEITESQKLQTAINPSIQLQITSFKSLNWSTHLNLQSSWRHQGPIQSETHPKTLHNTLNSQSRPKLAQKRKSIITQSYDIQMGNFKILNSSIQRELQFLFRNWRLIPTKSRSNNWSKKNG